MHTADFARTIASSGAANLVSVLQREIDPEIVMVRFESGDEEIVASSSTRWSARGPLTRVGRTLLQNVRATVRGGAEVALPPFWLHVEDVAPALSVIDYLRDHGGRVISAMHHDQPYSEPAARDVLHRRVACETGVYPAMYSADFLTGETVRHRQGMIDEVIRQWRDGCLVQIMFHVSPPQYATDEEVEGGWGTDAAAETLVSPNRVYSFLDDAAWNSLLTPGSRMHLNWISRMDEYGRLLRQLQEAGVTVMLRPFHEMNQHVFWWGGRPGPQGTASLFRWLRRHLEERFALRNILWVWNVQDLPDDYGHVDGDEKFSRYSDMAGGLEPYDANEWDDFNPGADWYDILSIDFYDDEGYSPRRYEQAKRIADRDGKPFIIGETFIFPTPEELEAQPKWALAMPWGIRTWNYNTPEVIARFYEGSVGAADLPNLTR